MRIYTICSIECHNTITVLWLSRHMNKLSAIRFYNSAILMEHDKALRIGNIYDIQYKNGIRPQLKPTLTWSFPFAQSPLSSDDVFGSI